MLSRIKLKVQRCRKFRYTYKKKLIKNFNTAVIFLPRFFDPCHMSYECLICGYICSVKRIYIYIYYITKEKLPKTEKHVRITLYLCYCVNLITQLPIETAISYDPTF